MRGPNSSIALKIQYFESRLIKSRIIAGKKGENHFTDPGIELGPTIYDVDTRTTVRERRLTLSLGTNINYVYIVNINDVDSKV